jgi:very-short-patch-repair endonuclease
MHRKLTRPASSQLNQARAHAMRFHPSPAEQRLWLALRGSQLGFAVRRQVVIRGRFIADFVVPARALIIEVDGRHHEQRRCADARRDRVLTRLGYRVLRIEAELVHRALPEAVARIVAVLAER